MYIPSGAGDRKRQTVGTKKTLERARCDGGDCKACRPTLGCVQDQSRIMTASLEEEAAEY